MPTKNQQRKNTPLPDLKKIITEIPVTKGHNTEPFIKVFHYSEENIEKSSLGSLVGIFEIADQDENSLFIVNFLTSVAKKEYFSNIRRGSIESFEATLHKINLALAESVKNGHVEWLGKLHGAIGVLEKNNLHFSVTGKAQILLLRKEALSEISEGLAPTDPDIHPLKTFIEISSGRLDAHDKVIFTSPEIFEVLTPEDIKKNAIRMDNEQFSQFLQTVLVNKLRMGGSLIVDFEETELISDTKKEPKQSSKAKIQNFFSQKPFEQAQKEKNAIIVDGTLNHLPEELPEKTEGYIDPRTQHIYVHGDTSYSEEKKSPLPENIQTIVQDSFHSLEDIFDAQRKSLKKILKKHTPSPSSLKEKTSEVLSIFFSTIYRLFHKAFTSILYTIQSLHFVSLLKNSARKTKISFEYKQSSPSDTEESFHKEEKSDNEETSTSFFKEKWSSFHTSTRETFPHILHFFVLFGNKGISFFSFVLKKIFSFSKQLFLLTFQFIRTKAKPLFVSLILFLIQQLRKEHQKRTAIFSSLLLIFILSIFFFFSPFQKETAKNITDSSTENIVPSPSPLEREKNAHSVKEVSSIFTADETILASVLLDDTVYLLTSQFLINTETNKKYSLPNEKKGSVALATPLYDLHLILITTDANEIFSFTPSNEKFVSNRIDLPEGTVIQSIGTYLTYLYILDAHTNSIYRFPRAEGGFGTRTLWTKEPLVLGESPRIAVNETIFVAPDPIHISAFFRGTFVRDLESPITPFILTTLFTQPDMAYIYALDSKEKRVLVWDQEGKIIAQYFSEQFSGLNTLLVSATENKIFVTTDKELLSFTLDPQE